MRRTRARARATFCAEALRPFMLGFAANRRSSHSARSGSRSQASRKFPGPLARERGNIVPLAISRATTGVLAVADTHVAWLEWPMAAPPDANPRKKIWMLTSLNA